MASTPVGSGQRFTRGRPCPICGGAEELPHGKGVRCYGFLSSDGEYAHCTREDLAGGIRPDKDGQSYAHILRGMCRCGVRHGEDRPDPPRLTIVKGKVTEVARYHYRDEQGAELYHVRRFAPKDFRPYLPGATYPGLADARRVPYRLPEVLAADPAAPVFVTEGEKDADALAALGLVATTSQGGAGQARQWEAEGFAGALAGRTVALVPDNDRDGRRFAEIAGVGLARVATDIRVVTLPGLPEKGDISDWLAAGGTAEQLLALAGEDLGPGETEATPEADVDPNNYEPSDTGNAELFAALYAGIYRHDHRRGKWYRWATHWWRGESDRHARLSSKEIGRRRMAAARDIADEAERKAALKWARASASSAHRDALLKRSADEVSLAADGEDWDTDPYLLGVGNGVVDLRAGTLRPGHPDERVTLRTPIPFDPHAPAARWERFLSEVFEGDAEQVAWLGRMVGYSLTGDIAEHAFVVCFGGGSNGKSTLFTILNHLLGDYAGALNFSALAHTQYEAHPTELAALMGKRFVTASELNEGQRLNEARIKGLTGGDIIKARFMRQDEFEFRPALKLWLAVNHKPVVRDDSRGFWRRMRLLEFRRSFPINQQLEPELRAESPGILAWAVRGCLDWQVRGLGSTTAIEEATRAYREESDPLIAFVAECCNTGGHLVAGAKDLYTAYEAWAKEQGQREDERLGSKTFWGRMAERHAKKREATGVVYRGVALNAAWQERATKPPRYSG